MRISAGFVFSVIGALAVGSILIWFWFSFDRVPIERVGKPAREARVNSLLAAELLLREFGKEVHGLSRLNQTPPVGGTLFLPASRRGLSDELIENLNAWVRGGGHLVVVAPSQEERGKDRILDDWGISGREQADSQSMVRVQIKGWEKPIELQFFQVFEVYEAVTGSEDWVESELGTHVLRIPSGEGHLTVLSDYSFATNDLIGEHDHAAFLWHLLSQNQSREVWLVHGLDSPSLWDHLLNDAWMVLVSVALLMVLMIWISCRRFGPLIPNQSLKRRRLLEHIEASGRFLWRYRQSEELLHAVQASLLRSLEFRHPGWSASADLHRKLAQASGFTQKAVTLALTQREVREEHTFTEMVKTLELIRNRL